MAAGTGLRLFWSWIEPGDLSRTQSIAREGRTAGTVALGLVAVLFVSGVIEAFVTPSSLPTEARVGIGIVAELCFFAYVFGLGRAAYRRGHTGDIDAAPARGQGRLRRLRPRPAGAVVRTDRGGGAAVSGLTGHLSGRERSVRSWQTEWSRWTRAVIVAWPQDAPRGAVTNLQQGRISRSRFYEIRATARAGEWWLALDPPSATPRAVSWTEVSAKRGDPPPTARPRPPQSRPFDFSIR